METIAETTIEALLATGETGDVFLEDGEGLRGAVVRVSPALILIHDVDEQYLLDSHSLIPAAAVEGCEVNDGTRAATRVLGLRGEPPTDLEWLPIGSWSAALEVIAERRALVAVYQEGDEDFYVGYLSLVGDASVSVRLVYASGEMAESQRIRLSEISRIRIGGGFLDSIERVVEHSRRLFDDAAGDWERLRIHLDILRRWHAHIVVERRGLPGADDVYGFVSYIGRDYLFIRCDAENRSLAEHAALRYADLTALIPIDAEDDHGRLALELAGELPPAGPPEPPERWGDLLASLPERHRVIAVDREGIVEDALLVARPIRSGSEHLAVRPIAAGGDLEDEIDLPVAEITRVDVGGSYLEAMELLAADAERRG